MPRPTMGFISLTRYSAGPIDLVVMANGQRHLPAEIRRSTNTVVWILAGSCVSPPDDDRTEHTPVGLAGVEQGTDPVLLEVAEAEADPFDPLDQVVECFRRSVRDAGQVEVGDFGEPGTD